MNELEWLTCDDPRSMASWLTEPALLREGPARRPSDRKLRLIAIAVARHGGCGSWASVGHLIKGAEAMADGGHHGLSTREVRDAEEYAASWLIGVEPEEVLERVLGHYRPDVTGHKDKSCQANIVHDIVGNPFRVVPLCADIEGYPVKHRDGRGCKWCEAIRLNRTVQNVALAAYQDRLPGGCLKPTHLYVLSDALLDAGIRDTESWSSKSGPHPLIGHLRSPGPKYLGMWSLDAILGKG